MLQQTRVESVLPYFERFLDRFPDLASLASADLEEVLRLWEGLGYYSRARNLHKAAQELMENYNGILPDNARELQKLPGIGKYTAAAIASIAFGEPTAAVDGNIRRIYARLLALDEALGTPALKRPLMTTRRSSSPYQTRRLHPGIDGPWLCDLPASNPNCIACPISSRCKV